MYVCVVREHMENICSHWVLKRKIINMNIINDKLLIDEQLVNKTTDVLKKDLAEEHPQLNKYLNALVKNTPMPYDKYYVEDQIYDFPEDQVVAIKPYMAEGTIVALLKDNKEVKKHFNKYIKDMAVSIMLDTASRCANIKRDNFARKQKEKEDALAKKKDCKKQLQEDKISQVKEKLKNSITSRQKADIKKVFGVEI